jgi:hypothetical protein
VPWDGRPIREVNRDGLSRPGLLQAKADRLESLKWDDEVGWATFVVAEMDWALLVRRFSRDFGRATPAVGPP